MSTVSKGKLGEDLACQFLTNKGFEVIERNFASRNGEIDIVCRDGKDLVFVEVKSKFRSDAIPEEEFAGEKYRRFNEAILAYLFKRNIDDDNYRIDLVAMNLEEASKTCRVRHYRGYY